MMLPVYVFLAVSLLFFGAGMLMARTGRSDQARVFAAGQRRSMIFGPLTPALGALLPLGEKTRKRLALELCQAGYYHHQAPAEYLALRNVLVIGWVILIATLIVVASQPGEPLDLRLLIAGLVGMIVLYAVPRLVLSSRAKARVGRIEAALPDGLDMISMCMTGGLSFGQALSRVGGELAGTYPDLACELRIVSHQADSGSLGKAMRGFAQRVDTPEVQTLSSLIGQTERQGGAVASAFQDFAMEVRRQRRQLAEEKGNRTSIHMLFPLILCLAPPVYLLLLTPAAIELRNFVMEENGPGGVLSPIDATETLRNPMRFPLEPQETASDLTRW